jgi:hypothetical protein
VEFLENAAFRDHSHEGLLARVPSEYSHSFLIVADKAAMEQSDFSLLVMDLFDDRSRTFRAVPSQIQSIENNLSRQTWIFVTLPTASMKMVSSAISETDAMSFSHVNSAARGNSDTTRFRVPSG